MASFSSIYTSIHTILTSLSTVDHVYKQEGPDPDGYPFITLVHMGNDSEVLDEVQNFRTYKYRVRIYISSSKGNMGPEKAEETLGIVLDEIIDAFDTDHTLGGTVQQIIPLVSEPGYTEFSGGVSRVGEIILSVRKCESIT